MRIYYTGDVANLPGWFEVIEHHVDYFQLHEIDGDRVFNVARRQIGEVYRGHCDPRFVTEDAYRAFYAKRLH